jgi:quercetin dioxygenase-like cupin family protein
MISFTQPRVRGPIGALLFLICLCVVAIKPAKILEAPETHIHNAQPATTSRPATVVKPLSCEKLADLPGNAITTATVLFPPNAYTPAHRHPGSVTAYVIKGAIRSQLAGGPPITYTAGDTWFEPTGALHLFAENASTTETAELLVVFVANENCGPLVIPEPQSLK